MARKPKAVATSVVGGRELRDRSKKIEYNVQKLSEKTVEVPKVKKAPAAKKSAKKKTSTKRTSTSYLVLVKKALKDVEAPGWGVVTIANYLAENYPDKTNTRFIRLALASGVSKKVFVKTKGTYRLSKHAQDSATKKRKSTAKTSTVKKGAKKATSTRKKATTDKRTTKRSTTKKADKKSTNKRASTSKTSKKRVAESITEAKSPKKAKKVIGPPPGDVSATVSEAIGKWQYWDNGWFHYAETANAIVEGVYQEYNADNNLRVRPVQSGHFSYTVDFGLMEQTNVTTNTVRKIRRL